MEKHPSFRAHLAVPDSASDSSAEDDDSETEPAGEEDDTANFCQSCGPDDEFHVIVDRVEQDVVCAFLAASCPLDEESVCDDSRKCSCRVHCSLWTRTGTQAWSASREGGTRIQADVRARDQEAA